MTTATDADCQAAAWVLPGEPVSVRLMNTVWADRPGVHDALTTRGNVAGWLAATGLAGNDVPVTAGDLASFRRLRDALRRLAAKLTADARPTAAAAIGDVGDAVAEVNKAAAVNPTTSRLRLLADVLNREDAAPGPPALAALPTLADEAIDLLTNQSGPLLRACQAPGCVLYFVKDHPRRHWCSTACGNRARAARHYRRHRPGASARI